MAIAFRELGFTAFSCDILPPSGGHPEWHIQEDVLPYINGNCKFTTVDGTEHELSGKWDMMICHPPCTYLTVTGNRWFNVEKYGEQAIERMRLREEAADFFMSLVNADCEHIAVENPVGVMNTRYRKPDQKVQPYLFGDPYEKMTCFWLKNLPLLEPTDIVEPEPRQIVRSGKTLPTWYSNCGGNRPVNRSKTFPGIAKAIANQWGKFLLEMENI